MEDGLKRLQIQTMRALNSTEIIINHLWDMVKYLNFDSSFINELKLTHETFNDAVKRLSKTILKNDLHPFVLGVKQINMMAKDLLVECKKKIKASA